MQLLTEGKCRLETFGPAESAACDECSADFVACTR